MGSLCHRIQLSTPIVLLTVIPISKALPAIPAGSSRVQPALVRCGISPGLAAEIVSTGQSVEVTLRSSDCQTQGAVDHPTRLAFPNRTFE